jgi:hypothetical protein
MYLPLAPVKSTLTLLVGLIRTLKGEAFASNFPQWFPHVFSTE